jgi:hypothetical protein
MKKRKKCGGGMIGLLIVMVIIMALPIMAIAQAPDTTGTAPPAPDEVLQLVMQYVLKYAFLPAAGVIFWITQKLKDPIGIDIGRKQWIFPIIGGVLFGFIQAYGYPWINKLAGTHLQIILAGWVGAVYVGLGTGVAAMAWNELDHLRAKRKLAA